MQSNWRRGRQSWFDSQWWLGTCPRLGRIPKVRELQSWIATDAIATTENCVHQGSAAGGRHPCERLMRTAAGPLATVPMPSGHAWLVGIVVVPVLSAALQLGNARRIRIVVGMAQFRFSCLRKGRVVEASSRGALKRRRVDARSNRSALKPAVSWWDIAGADESAAATSSCAARFFSRAH